jgi:deoxycytidylate deaminase
MRHVVGILVKDGKPISIGSNYHTDCKREGMPTGEGYELCAKCHWTNHAEAVALRNGVGDLELNDIKGSKLYLYGHTYACDACKDTAEHYGVEIILTGKEWNL